MAVQLEKVTVSIEEYETITEALSEYSVEEIVTKRATADCVAIGSLEEKLLAIPFDTLMRAVYIGYESPADKLAKYIRYMVPEDTSAYDAFNISYLSGKADGAKEAAEILGVTLPERTDAN